MCIIYAYVYKGYAQVKLKKKPWNFKKNKMENKDAFVLTPKKKEFYKMVCTTQYFGFVNTVIYCCSQGVEDFRR